MFQTIGRVDVLWVFYPAGAILVYCLELLVDFLDIRRCELLAARKVRHDSTAHVFDDGEYYSGIRPHVAKTIISLHSILGISCEMASHGIFSAYSFGN